MREGWKEVKLGEISDIYSGFAFKSKEMTTNANGIPLVKIKNIFDRKVSNEFDSYLLEKYDNAKFNKYRLLQGDILVAMTGQGSVGRIGKMHFVNDKIYVNQRVGIVRVNENLADKEFVYQQLATKDNETIYFNLALGAGQPNLSPADIGNKIINLPPLKTQKKIASILSGYDDLIENNLKRIKILEEMAQQTYEEWFVRMRFPGHQSATINPETGLPEGWEKVKLGDVSIFKYGSMPKKEDLVESGYPVYSGYRITGFSNRFNVSKKSLIVVARGVGGTGDVKFSPEKCWLTNLSILVNLHNNELINYLFYYLKSANLRSLDSGAAQSQITIVSLEPFPIILPNIQLIKQFNEIVEPIFKTIDNLQNQNQRLREARDIFLPRLMMGMIEV